jgi:hypothetical protein
VEEAPLIRAWECAYVLSEDCADELTLDQFVFIETVMLAGPECLDLNQANDLLAIYQSVRGNRT